MRNKLGGGMAVKFDRKFISSKYPPSRTIYRWLIERITCSRIDEIFENCCGGMRGKRNVYENLELNIS